MYLFSRQLTLQGPMRDTMAWAVEVTEYVNEHGSLPVTLWTSTMGNPIGTVLWSARAESHAELFDGMAAIQADDAYHDLIEKAVPWVHQPGTDTFGEFVLAPDTTEPPQVAVVTTAVMASGRQPDAIEWGVEISNHTAKVTKRPVAFLTETYGTFGQVTWIQGFDDMAQVDAAHQATNNDDGFLERIVKGGDLFLDGSAREMLATRVV